MTTTALLSLYSTAVAYGDGTPNSNPSLKYFDWRRQVTNIPVDSPASAQYTLAPAENRLIFDGGRDTDIDNTTVLALAGSSLDPARYRLSHLSGTAPAFRVNRAVAVSGIELSLAVASNGSLLITAATGTPFTSVVVGDNVFIPGTSTGDTGIGFSVLNEGWWYVIGTTPTTIMMIRLPGETFVGATEVVTPTANTMQVYSNTGVQVGDKVDINSGFAVSALGVYEVAAVTATWIEFISTMPLMAESATPGASGVIFYSSSKVFLRIETDQRCVVRVNGDTGDCQRIEPWLAGDMQKVGEFVKVGPCWSLRVVNKSLVPANITVISAE